MKGLLLINLGTPSAPDTKSVRRYLRQFLSDPFVIDTNPIARRFLVNAIIAPFRSPKSVEAYKKIWMPEGSPLLVHSVRLVGRIGQILKATHYVELGMRYGKPSIGHALDNLLSKNVEEIIVFPLYPQFADSSTQSSIEEVMRHARKRGVNVKIKVVPPFFNHPSFIDAFTRRGREMFQIFKPDHILFSFHGLPERHIRKLDMSGYCFSREDCCEDVFKKGADNKRVILNGVKNPTSPRGGFFGSRLRMTASTTSDLKDVCYRAQCFETARLIADALKIPSERYTVSFQSRLGRTPWIKPYTDLVLPELAQKGIKRLAVFCPSFVADCLETLEEIGLRGKKSFLSAGGEGLLLVFSLNSESYWVDAVCQMVKECT